jgi:hypothetical protein
MDNLGTPQYLGKKYPKIALLIIHYSLSIIH